MDLYTELYGWIWISFGKEEFSIDQFRAVFPTPQAAKVVHDMAEKGYLDRTSRGHYKALEPDSFVKRITQHEEPTDIMDNAKRPFAFCDSTAVSIWTDGYYWSGFTKGFKPVHVAVKEQDLAYWRDFLKKKKAKYAVEDERQTLFGRVYILHPRKTIKPVSKDGSKVVPLKEVVRYCLDHEMIYEPALKFFEEKYQIDSGKVAAK